MAEPFMAEIRIMSFGFPPKGWALCNGQLMQINQNQALFSLLGTTYGGDGRTTFGLPNLQARVPVHVGDGLTLGEVGGEAAHTLTLAEGPQHPHTAMASSDNGSTVVATGNVLAAANNLYTAAQQLTPLLPGTVTPVGGSQAHENMAPYLTLNFCIALQGIFPSPN